MVSDIGNLYGKLVGTFFFPLFFFYRKRLIFLLYTPGSASYS